MVGYERTAVCVDRGLETEEHERKGMRQQSKKRSARMKEVFPIRSFLIEEAGRVCMNCGHGPANPHRGMPIDCSCVHCHEILGGPLRDKTLDEPCSLLVLCWHCNSGSFTDRQRWPIPRQLALLMACSPQHYDLTRFCWLRNENAPRFVEQYEVDEYVMEFQ